MNCNEGVFCIKILCAMSYNLRKSGCNWEFYCFSFWASEIDAKIFEYIESLWKKKFSNFQLAQRKYSDNAYMHALKLHKHQLLLVILSAWTFPLVYCCTSFRAMAHICAWVLVYMCSVYVYVFSSVRVCLLACLNIANVEYTCIVTIQWREYKTD